MNTLKTKLIYLYIVFSFVLVALEIWLHSLLFAGAAQLEAATGIPEIVFECVCILAGLMLFVAFSYAYWHRVSKAVAEETARQMRQRSLLFANIAHDLKNPMASILGYARALEAGNAVPGERENVCRTISQKALQVDDMVQKLFRYARLESEGYALSLREADVCAIVRECTALRYDDIEARRVQLEAEIPEEAILHPVDAAELTRVIDNLITNALRHNEAGIRLLVSVSRQKNGVRIAVADSGQPIPQSIRESIFEPFQCSDASRQTKDGSGLGLAIARRIMQLHGGGLRVVDGFEGYTKAFVADM